MVVHYGRQKATPNQDAFNRLMVKHSQGTSKGAAGSTVLPRPSPLDLYKSPKYSIPKLRTGKPKVHISMGDVSAKEKKVKMNKVSAKPKNKVPKKIVSKTRPKTLQSIRTRKCKQKKELHEDLAHLSLSEINEKNIKQLLNKANIPRKKPSDSMKIGVDKEPDWGSINEVSLLVEERCKITEKDNSQKNEDNFLKLNSSGKLLKSNVNIKNIFADTSPLSSTPVSRPYSFGSQKYLSAAGTPIVLLKDLKVALRRIDINNLTAYGHSSTDIREQITFPHSSDDEENVQQLLQKAKILKEKISDSMKTDVDKEPDGYQINEVNPLFEERYDIAEKDKIQESEDNILKLNSSGKLLKSNVNGKNIFADTYPLSSTPVSRPDSLGSQKCLQEASTPIVLFKDLKVAMRQRDIYNFRAYEFGVTNLHEETTFPPNETIFAENTLINESPVQESFVDISVVDDSLFEESLVERTLPVKKIKFQETKEKQTRILATKNSFIRLEMCDNVPITILPRRGNINILNKTDIVEDKCISQYQCDNTTVLALTSKSRSLDIKFTSKNVSNTFLSIPKSQTFLQKEISSQVTPMLHLMKTEDFYLFFFKIYFY